MVVEPVKLRIGVLALQGSFREHMTLLRRIPGVEPVEVRTKEELDSVAGLIIPGQRTRLTLCCRREDLLPPPAARRLRRLGPFQPLPNARWPEHCIGHTCSTLQAARARRCRWWQSGGGSSQSCARLRRASGPSGAPAPASSSWPTEHLVGALGELGACSGTLAGCSIECVLACVRSSSIA